MLARGDYHPIDDLPRFRDTVATCPSCHSTDVASQPAHDLTDSQEAKCLDCGRTGRVKINQYGRIEWIQGFLLPTYEE